MSDDKNKSMIVSEATVEAATDADVFAVKAVKTDTLSLSTSSANILPGITFPDASSWRTGAVRYRDGVGSLMVKPVAGRTFRIDAEGKTDKSLNTFWSVYKAETLILSGSAYWPKNSYFRFVASFTFETTRRVVGVGIVFSRSGVSIGIPTKLTSVSSEAENISFVATTKLPFQNFVMTYG